MIEINLKKSNEKRAKKGLAPQSIDKNAFIKAKKEE